MTSHNTPWTQAVRRKPLPIRDSTSTTSTQHETHSIDSRSRPGSPANPLMLGDPTLPQPGRLAEVPEPSSQPPPIPGNRLPSSLAPEPQYVSISEPPAVFEPELEPEPVPTPPPAAVSPSEAYALPSASFAMTALPMSPVEDQGTFRFPEPERAPIVVPYPTVVGVKGPAKLTKENPQPWGKRHDSLISQRHTPPPPEDASPTDRSGGLPWVQQPRGSGSSSQPSDHSDSRVSSPPRRAATPGDTKAAPANNSPPRKVEKLRRNFLTGGKSRTNSLEQGKPTSEAWVFSPDNSNAEYNLSLLVESEKVPELWNDMANVTVSLDSADSSRGPSFKIPFPAIASSLMLLELLQDTTPRSTSRSASRGHDYRDVYSAAGGGTRTSSLRSSGSLTSGSEISGEFYLQIPPPLPQNADTTTSLPIDRLVAIRNLFAFLTGQPLVGIKAHPTPFAAFLQIAALLEEFAFISPDGSSFGSEVDLSFGFYIRHLNLGDVRTSRDKTIEALILGERMRSIELYNEAFTHGVGKYSALVDLKSPLWAQVSRLTRQRLDRAHLDLLNRQHNVNVRIEQFDFPSIFAGVANSTALTEFRSVRFRQWRNTFVKMRSFTLSYYKTVFGSWPPKASSRKNPFSESGLNRLVLKALYSDMCALYDLLADRTAFTSRVMNKLAEETEETESETDPWVIALRRMLSEFDNSSPPVLPPIPFDIPMIPKMSSILETYDKMQPKEQARFDRKIKMHELQLVLEKSYDYNTNTVHSKNPFLVEFKEFEAKEARGKSAADIADQRIGYWLFMYVVIQSLPILVMDAPDLMHTDGVEYFLCQPPVGHPPWAEDGSHIRKMWYEVSGGAGYVELAADAVLFSTEAIHHRSHCWLAAKEWEAALRDGGAHGYAHPSDLQLETPYTAVPGGFDPDTRSPSTLSLDTSYSPALGASPVIRPRNNSPGSLGPPMRMNHHGHRSSVALGIEPVFDLPEGLMVPGERSSRATSHGFGHGSRDRSSSLGPSPLSDLQQHRSVSVGNLSALGNMQSAAGSVSDLGSNPGATFDDILGTTKKTKKKRKTFFFA